VSEKLTTFPYGQYIVGNVCLLAYGEVVRFKVEVGVCEKSAKMWQSFYAQIMPSSNAKQQS